MREGARKMSERFPPPYWYILKVIDALESAGHHLTLYEFIPLFLELCRREQSIPYEVRETPKGLVSVEFLFDLVEMITNSRMLILLEPGHILSLTPKGRQELLKYKDPSFDEKVIFELIGKE